jgi:hypothetical protein
MKKILASLTILTSLCAIPALAATTTVTGTISDSMCKAKHGMEGMSDAQCVRDCVKAGGKFTVVSNGKVYTLEGKTADVSALAAKKATITGDLKGDTLTVSSIAAAK